METAASKYNSSDECQWNTTITIACWSYVQAWPVKPIQEPEESDMFVEESFDQGTLKKLTEKLSRVKESKKKEKSSGGRACKYSSIVFALPRDLF